MIRTKICGFTRPEDAQAAAELGVDAIGLVFYEKSKRFVSIEQAQAVVRVLPPFVSVVALFVNESAERIEEILAQVPIDILQFHGDEPPEFCRQFARPYIKAVRVQSKEQILEAEKLDVDYLLLDTYVKGQYGKSPAQINPEVISKIIGNDKPITCRPADLIEPQFEKFKDENKEFATSTEDILSYALFPEVAKKFLEDKWSKKYKIETTLYNSKDCTHPV